MRFPRKIRKLNFLITAGGTREYIDPVRFISNASSGKMGYELAIVAKTAGHNATLITATTSTTPPKGIGEIKVETTEEMFRTVRKHFLKCDCLIMAAAVSDYTPVKTSRLKIRKSSRPITLKLKPTPDILKWAGNHKHKRQIIVGFALEDRNLKADAERKMRDKHLDMVVANTPSAIGSEQTEVFVKSAGQKWLKFERESKHKIARRLIAMIQTLMPKSPLVKSDSNL